MSENQPKEQPSEEVDLGQLFKLIGRTFDRFFKFFGNVFYKLFLAFVWFVFFTKRHLIKLVLAGVLGFAYGFIKQKTSAPVYKTSIVVKQNYKTGESLYNTIDYYNELILEQDSVTLSGSLKINHGEANNLISLEIESILNENQKLKIYDSYLKEIDSSLASGLDFDSFLEKFNDFDYAFQKLTLRSRTKNNSRNILTSIVENVESIPYYKNEQNKDLQELSRIENVVKESLKESDSLQKIYQIVLEKSVENTLGSQTSVTIDNTEDKSITKEFELYNSDIELRRELVRVERQKQDLENIIEIVSSEFEDATLDRTVNLLGSKTDIKIKNAIILMLVVFIVLLAREFINFIERFKKKI